MTNVLPLPPSLAVIVLVVLAFLKKYNFSTAGNCTIKSEAWPVNIIAACLASFAVCALGPLPLVSE